MMDELEMLRRQSEDEARAKQLDGRIKPRWQAESISLFAFTLISQIEVKPGLEDHIWLSL